MAQDVSVELIGPGVELSERLRADLAESAHASFAVAFAKPSALNVLDLEGYLAKNRKLRLLAGLDFELTDLSIIHRLSPLGANCRVFRSLGSTAFHPKLYLLDHEDGERRVVYVGSSNLTGGGLGGNVEVNVRVEGQKGEALLERAEQIFEALFNSPEALEVTRGLSEAYGKAQKIRRRANEGCARDLRDALLELGESLERGRRTGGQYWLLVARPENYDVWMSRQEWGEQHRGKLHPYGEGDTFFLYVTSWRKIRAMGRFTRSGLPCSLSPLMGEEADVPKGRFPFRIPFEVLEELRAGGVSLGAAFAELESPPKWMKSPRASRKLTAVEFEAIRQAFVGACRGRDSILAGEDASENE